MSCHELDHFSARSKKHDDHFLSSFSDAYTRSVTQLTTLAAQPNVWR